MVVFPNEGDGGCLLDEKDGNGWQIYDADCLWSGNVVKGKNIIGLQIESHTRWRIQGIP